jgi:hypothetical protein
MLLVYHNFPAWARGNIFYLCPDEATNDVLGAIARKNRLKAPDELLSCLEW